MEAIFILDSPQRRQLGLNEQRLRLKRRKTESNLQPALPPPHSLSILRIHFENEKFSLEFCPHVLIDDAELIQCFFLFYNTPPSKLKDECLNRWVCSDMLRKWCYQSQLGRK